MYFRHQFYLIQHKVNENSVPTFKNFYGRKMQSKILTIQRKVKIAQQSKKKKSHLVVFYIKYIFRISIINYREIHLHDANYLHPLGTKIRNLIPSAIL